MEYHLIHTLSNVMLRQYRTLAAARIAMRVSNKNAGYSRLTRCSSGSRDWEWCMTPAFQVTGVHSTYSDGPYSIKIVNEST